VNEKRCHSNLGIQKAKQSGIGGERDAKGTFVEDSSKHFVSRAILTLDKTRPG